MGELVEELQRCRRMVAGMRGLVMSSSIRAELLKEMRKEHDDRLNRRGATREALSPRTRHLRDFQTQRICIIQRQWRKHRFQRILAEKIRLERKWRTKKNNAVLQHQATAIQRVIRGSLTRKRLREGRPTVFTIIQHTSLEHRLQQQRSRRLEYRKQVDSRTSQLAQERKNLHSAQQDKATTERKIAVAGDGNEGLQIDAKLLDGTVVRMEAHQLLLHQSNEIDRVQAAIARLEAEVHALMYEHVVPRRAVIRIQTLIRAHLQRQRQLALLRQQQRALVKLRLSADRCFARMNVGFLRRQQQSWQAAAVVLRGFYSIIIAKRLARLHRQRRAVALIEKIYRQKRDRVDAHDRVAWRRTQLRATVFGQRRLHRYLRRVLKAWSLVVTRERNRQRTIATKLINGQSEWVTSKAIKMQRWFRHMCQTRRTLAAQLEPALHLVVTSMLDSVIAMASDPREQFKLFYQRVIQTVHTWQPPTEQLHFLAQRYEMPLDRLPVDQVWAWILETQGAATLAASEAAWYLDIRKPFTVRTLRFLAPLSTFFDLYDSLQQQTHHIWVHYEAVQCIRHYLQCLYEQDAVVFTESTTYSARHRQRVVQILQTRSREEAEAGRHPRPVLPNHSHQHAFTMFHCVATDLCENCLAMQIDRSASSCGSCGMRHLEQSTVTQSSHAAVTKAPLKHQHPAHGRWIRETERCDFLILNAFFHALAPHNHIHRDTHSAETLWKVTLSKAFQPITLMYQEHGVHTLDDLLTAKNMQAWDTILPPPVIDKLELFVHLIKDELMQLQQNG